MTAYDAGVQVTAVVRIEISKGQAALGDVTSLRELPAHSRVIVDVGDIETADDPRVLEFLAEHARDRCLHLEIHGSLDAVRRWAHDLRHRPPPPPQVPLRHLAPVDDGDRP